MNSNINRPPGILEYSGQYKTEPIKIDVYAYDKKAWLNKSYDQLDDITLHPQNTWINITGLHDISLLKSIEKKFGINRLILEDITQVSRHSKIESFEHYTFSIFKKRVVMYSDPFVTV